MRKSRFTLEDFMRQLDEVRKLGPPSQIIGTIPGMKEMIDSTKTSGDQIDSQMDRMQGIYDSMTNEERHSTNVLDDHRRRRIARGAGVDQSDVGKFIKQFEMTCKMMRAIKKWGDS